MRERIAQAICEKGGLVYTGQAVFFDLSDAVLAAMAEPTQAMVESGAALSGFSSDVYARDNASGIWETMIEAAQKESQ